VNVNQLFNFIWMILKDQLQTVWDKTLISDLRSYAWPVRATNYGRWCRWRRWWLQSNR